MCVCACTLRMWQREGTTTNCVSVCVRISCVRVCVVERGYYLQCNQLCECVHVRQLKRKKVLLHDIPILLRMSRLTVTRQHIHSPVDESEVSLSSLSSQTF